MKYFIVIIVSFCFFLFSDTVFAASMAQNLSGRILLSVEQHGEAWYVYPQDNKRYYLGRPADAFKIMRELGLGIREIDFQRLAKAGMEVDGDLPLAKKLSGQIILQVEKNGEAWYVYPQDNKIYYLGRPADAFEIMRELGLGITQENLAKIHKPGLSESINKYSHYKHETIVTKNGSFSVDYITIDLDNPNLEIITQVSEPFPTATSGKKAMGANTLAEFVLSNNGFAGINGTYFDTGQSARNYYFYPIYDTNKSELINAHQLKYWTTGPIMAFDEDNNFYYFKDSREFKSLENFESTYNVKIQAAIGNKPRLIEKKMNLLLEWDIDDKQRYTKAQRNALGYKKGSANSSKGVIYLLVAQNATVPDLADIMKYFDVDYALNLDGGYSSALWYNDEYMVMPGRDIPNAIIFRE